MKRQDWRSALRAGIAITVAIGLLLLVIAPGHSSVPLSCILFVPLLIAGMVIVPAAFGRLREADPQVLNSVLSDPRRYQRPPPAVLA
jgi:hypothetical protein